MSRVAFIILVAFLVAQAGLSFGVQVWRSWAPGDRSGAVLALRDSVYVAGRGALTVWDRLSGSYRRYTRLDGLPRTDFCQVCSGQGGSVFFGAPGVVVEMRGESWRSWDLPDGIGSSLCVDGCGSVWAIGKWDDDGSTALGVLGPAGWTFGSCPFKTLQVVCGARGAVWFATQDGLVRFDGRSLEQYQYPWGESWFCDWMTVDQQGRVWVKHLDTFNVLDEASGAWTSYTMYSPFWLDLDSEFAVDRSGKIWVCSETRGLIEFDGTGYVSHGMSRETLAGLCRAVCVDPDGSSVWVTSPYRGLFHFSQGVFERWSVSEGLRALPVSMAVDDDGSIWFGCEGGKLASYSEGMWHWPVDMYRSGDGLSSISDMALTPEGELLLVYDGGLYLLPGAEGPAIPFGPGATGEDKYWRTGAVVVGSGGEIWVGSSGGSRTIARYDPSGWSRFEFTDWPWLWGWLEGMIADPISGVWLAGWSPTLVHFDGGEWERFDEVEGETFLSLAFDASRTLWAGSSRGPWVFRPCESRWFQIVPEWEGTQMNEMDDFYVAYVDASGRKWFGGHDQVWMLDSGGWQVFNTCASPLIGGDVTDIVVDTEGQAWFCTTQGVSRLTFREGAVVVEITALVVSSPEGPLLRILARCSNQIGELCADVYLWVTAPSGERFFLPSCSHSPTPMLRGLHIPDGWSVDGLLLYHSSLVGLAPGVYRVSALLTNHGCFHSSLSKQASTLFTLPAR